MTATPRASSYRRRLLRLTAAAGLAVLPALAMVTAALSERAGATPSPAVPAQSPITPRLEAALLPLFSAIPSDADLARTKSAVDAVFKKDPSKLKAETAAISDLGAQKLVLWYFLRSDRLPARPDDIEKFRAANPDWPGVELRARAEEMLLMEEPDGAKIRAFFEKAGAPWTGPGKAALAAALLQAGNKAGASKLAAEAWRTSDLTKEEEEAIIRRVGSLLGPADHKFRIDRILFNDSRWEGTRKSRLDAAARVLRFLTAEDKLKAEYRMAVYRCVRANCMAGAKNALAKLPKDALSDPGVHYHRVQHLRRSGAEKEAIALLLKAPTDGARMVSPDDWWIERRVNIYNALYDRDFKTAYRLAADHGPLSVNPLKDAEFMAGWIALRFLNDPKRALTHFEALAKAADGPYSLAEADYWLGRTRAVLGDKAAMQQHYARAGVHFHTFYGQVARHMLEPKTTLLEIPPTAPPSAEDIERFLARDVVRAAVIARKAGLTDLMRVLISDLRFKLKSEGEMALLAQLALSLGDTQMAVRVGKTAMEKGMNLAEFAYPIGQLPAFEPLRPLPEEAIFYAIARQESEFNTLTVSGAGAAGILQVMPVTARHICQQYKIKCDLSRLTSDPAYNAKLATAYVADRHDDFGGSYILAFAGYNAGPGRARQWIKQNGDPRDPKVDPIDWIELIHIEETRDYVQKVMSNLQVYRARLGNAGKAMRIGNDLVRPLKGGLTAAN